MAFSLLSLASFPPTGGFLAKLYLFSSAVDAGKSYLAVIGVVATVVSLGYYLRFTLALYTRAGGRARSPVRSALREPSFATATAATAAAVVLWLGVAPGADARLGARRGLDAPAVTFSIVACDIAPRRGASPSPSRSLAIGAVVPWLEAGVGAVATQALTNVSYGPHGLALIAGGLERARDARSARRCRPRRDERQVGIVDARGRSASHTGASCLPWAGGRSGRGYAAQGDLLAGPGVIDAMGTSFEAERWGPLARRLLDALRAGDAAGGDRRGRPVGGAPHRDAGRGLRRLGQRAARPARRRPPRADRRAGAPARAVRAARRARTPDEQRLPLEGELLEELRDLLARPARCCPRAGRACAALRDLGRRREPRGALVGR